MAAASHGVGPALAEGAASESTTSSDRAVSPKGLHLSPPSSLSPRPNSSSTTSGSIGQLPPGPCDSCCHTVLTINGEEATVWDPGSYADMIEAIISGEAPNAGRAAAGGDGCCMEGEESGHAPKADPPFHLAWGPSCSMVVTMPEGSAPIVEWGAAPGGLLCRFRAGGHAVAVSYGRVRVGGGHERCPSPFPPLPPLFWTCAWPGGASRPP